MCHCRCMSCGEEKECDKCCDEHMKEKDGKMHCDKCGYDGEKPKCEKCGGDMECKKEEEHEDGDKEDEELEEMPVDTDEEEM